MYSASFLEIDNFRNENGRSKLVSGAPWKLSSLLTPCCENVPTQPGADDSTMQVTSCFLGYSVWIFPCLLQEDAETLWRDRRQAGSGADSF